MKCKTKRRIALLLSFLFLFSAPVQAAAADVRSFTDLKKDWSYPYIEWCVERGIMTGMTDTVFAPNGPVTRAQFVTVLQRIAAELGFNMNGYTSAAVFRDAAKGWYAQSVAWGYQNGVVNGTSETTFGPNEPLLRRDMATLLYRFIKQYLCYDAIDEGAVSLSVFADKSKIPSYAKDAVAALAGSGLMAGDGTNFNPNAGARRCEMAKVLKCLVEYVEENDAVDDYARLKRGINLYTFACRGKLLTREAGKSDPETVLKKIKAAGYDHIRLPIGVVPGPENGKTSRDSYQNDNGTYHISVSQEVIEDAAADVKAALAEGLAVVVDLHYYYTYASFLLHGEEIMENARALCSTDEQRASCDRILERYRMSPDDACWRVYGVNNEDILIDVSSAAREYLLNIIRSPVYDKELFAEVWGKIAAAFCGVEGPVFFELLNERSVSGETAEAAIRAIRATGGENVERYVIVYSYCWQYFTDRGVDRKIGREEWDFGTCNDDPYVMFDIHNYSPQSYTEAGAGIGSWPTEGTLHTRQASMMEARMIAADDLRTRTGRRVWFGEWGVHVGVNDKKTYVREFVAAAKKYAIPICIWCAGDSTIDPFVFYDYYLDRWLDDTTKWIFS